MMGGINDIDIAAFNPEVPGVQIIERADFFVTSWAATEMLVMPRRFGGAFTPIDGGDRILVSGEGDNGLPTHDLTAEIYVP